MITVFTAGYGTQVLKGGRMASRRTILKLGLAAAAGGVFAKSAMARTVPQSGLVFPDGFRLTIEKEPSPPVTPFKVPLFEMPKCVPVSRSVLEANGGAIDPLRHQRFNDFLPQKFYIQRLQEFRWKYHSDFPYNQGSWSWGFDGITPGCTFITRYGEPLFVPGLFHFKV